MDDVTTRVQDRWLLPDGVEDVLPPEAWQLERIRRDLLDLFTSWGYEYVIPPMIEFIESLLTGTGRDLDLKTFKVTDQLTGRTMGIRADITPQTARIDAHSLNRSGSTRLCYSGTVLNTRADNMLASRTPIVVGAELFGDEPGTDLEIVSLMVASLTSIGIRDFHIELGDVGIFRELILSPSMDSFQTEALFQLVQQKSVDLLRRELAVLKVPRETSELIETLPSLCGSIEVLQRAIDLFHEHPKILGRLEQLQSTAQGLQNRFPDISLYFDLSELRGYSYHTGIVFAAYLNGLDQAVAKGGRYDNVGQVFGRSRRAVGFDLGLRPLLHSTAAMDKRPKKVSAPFTSQALEAARWRKVCDLREAGYQVIESAVHEQQCDYVLRVCDGQWLLQPVENQAEPDVARSEE